MKSGHKTIFQIMVIGILSATFPTIAYAHTGLGDVSGLVSGFSHPFTGLDHFCAMIGVGLWAAQRGGRSIWLIPLAFLCVMALGGLFGMFAISIPFVETGIVASILILGILIAAAVRMPLLQGVLIVGTFALFHGHAHGAEMPLTVSGMMYGIGFLAATAVLHACGVGFGLVARQSRSPWLIRSAGAALVLCGIVMCLTL